MVASKVGLEIDFGGKKQRLDEVGEFLPILVVQDFFQP